MNKKGFTLIELLAVIVILAIIALIATPVVLNIIDDAKGQSKLRSADFYLDAVELSIAQATLKGQNITDGVYGILESGNICLENYVLQNGKYVCTDKDENPNNNELVVEVKGEVPNLGSIEIKNGQIEDVSLNISNDTVGKNNKGEIAYIEKLTDICEVKTDSEPTGISVGDKYECTVKAGTKKTFYVLEVKTDEVTLILNGNYDETMQPWCDQSGPNKDSNSCNADGLTPKLNEISNDWTKLSRSKIGLPSKDQIIGADSEFDSNNSQISPTNKWLYQWEGNNNYNSGLCYPYGYWTSSSPTDYPDSVWPVQFDGNIGLDSVSSNRYGVRPVINLKIK